MDDSDFFLIIICVYCVIVAFSDNYLCVLCNSGLFLIIICLASGLFIFEFDIYKSNLFLRTWHLALLCAYTQTHAYIILIFASIFMKGYNLNYLDFYF